ncbi:uncharacterized protein LOC141617062 [Silene latifolia]|uniref:uncharacterized protein LOC141617062 n=1 Tax=Silene latifolia TaxID=37657 RepID=UPI003D76C81B
MIISTWNIRGFNKLAKNLEVLHFLKTKKIDILGLLETRVKQSKAKRILKTKFSKYNHCCNYNSHHNGRIWLLWDPASVNLSILQEEAQVVHCFVHHLSTGRKFHLSVVYGSNSAVYRRRLWDSMLTHAIGVGAWAAMGDFNIVRNAQEKISNTPPDLNDITDFNLCLERYGLDDLAGTGSEFTWYNKQDCCTRVYSKLDKVLTNADWKQFKFLNCWIDHPDYLDIVEGAWACRVKGNSMHRLMRKLKKVRLALCGLHSASFSNIEHRLDVKREELNCCFQELQQEPLSESLINKEQALSQEFWKLKEVEAKILIQRAKLHDLKHNDTCSSFFFAKIKERQQSQYVSEIQDVQGVTHYGLQNVGGAFMEYYQQLLGTVVPVQEIDPIIMNNGPCLAADDCALLTASITRSDIKSALFSIHSNKSPGLDGFSAGFFKSAWGIVEEDYCTAVEDFFKTSFLPKQANVTLVSLIPKKKYVQCQRFLTNFLLLYYIQDH